MTAQPFQPGDLIVPDVFEDMPGYQPYTVQYAHHDGHLVAVRDGEMTQHRAPDMRLRDRPAPTLDPDTIRWVLAELDRYQASVHESGMDFDGDEYHAALAAQSDAITEMQDRIRKALA